MTPPQKYTASTCYYVIVYFTGGSMYRYLRTLKRRAADSKEAHAHNANQVLSARSCRETYLIHGCEPAPYGDTQPGRRPHRSHKLRRSRRDRPDVAKGQFKIRLSAHHPAAASGQGKQRRPAPR